MTYVSPTKYLNPNLDFKRSGIIFYFMKSDTLFFLMGIDSTHYELTDFGGTVENEDFLNAAIREASEESMGLFNINRNALIEQSIAVYNDKSIIMFQPIMVDNVEGLISQYYNLYIDGLSHHLDQKYLENVSIISISESNLWLVLNDLNPSISQSNVSFMSIYPKIYSKIKEILLPLYSRLISFIKSRI